MCINGCAFSNGISLATEKLWTDGWANFRQFASTHSSFSIPSDGIQLFTPSTKYEFCLLCLAFLAPRSDSHIIRFCFAFWSLSNHPFSNVTTSLTFLLILFSSHDFNFSSVIRWKTSKMDNAEKKEPNRTVFLLFLFWIASETSEKKFIQAKRQSTSGNFRRMFFSFPARLVCSRLFFRHSTTFVRWQRFFFSPLCIGSVFFCAVCVFWPQSSSESSFYQPSRLMRAYNLENIFHTWNHNSTLVGCSNLHASLDRI